MSWYDQLQTASLGGVEFDCQSVDDEIGRRTATHVYPQRDGAEIEDMGRGARRTRLRAVFFGVDYETRLGKLIDVLDDQKESYELVHPILGTWQVRAERSPIHHDSGAADFAAIDLDLVEAGLNIDLETLRSVEALEDDVDESADEIEEVEVDATPSELESFVQSVSDAVSAVRSFAASARSAYGKILDAFSSVQNSVARAVAAVRAIGDVRSWGIVVALKKSLHMCRKLRRAIEGASPLMIAKRVAVDISASALAHAWLGSAGRADDIVRLNKVRNTFLIPADTLIRVRK